MKFNHRQRRAGTRLGWKIGQSPRVDRVFVARAAGTALEAENVDLSATDSQAHQFAKQMRSADRVGRIRSRWDRRCVSEEKLRVFGPSRPPRTRSQQGLQISCGRPTCDR